MDNDSFNWWTDEVTPPFRGKATEDEPGSFRIRDKDRPTVEAGWDVVGYWEVAEGEGIVITGSLALEPSQFVFEPRASEPRLRRLDKRLDERFLARFKFEDLKRVRPKQIRDVIRAQAAAYLEDPYFAIPDDLPIDHIVRKQVEVIWDAAVSGSSTGRPRTSDAELDEWARDVWEVLSRRPGGSLYKELQEKWHVSESTVKNSRLNRLRRTGRLQGKGHEMAPGPNFPKEETDG